MGPHSSFSASSDSAVFLVRAQDGNSVTEILRPRSILSSATSATWNHGPLSLSLPNFYSGQTRVHRLVLKYAQGKKPIWATDFKSICFRLASFSQYTHHGDIIYADQTEQGHFHYHSPFQSDGWWLWWVGQCHWHGWDISVAVVHVSKHLDRGTKQSVQS